MFSSVDIIKQLKYETCQHCGICHTCDEVLLYPWRKVISKVIFNTLIFDDHKFVYILVWVRY